MQIKDSSPDFSPLSKETNFNGVDGWLGLKSKVVDDEVEEQSRDFLSQLVQNKVLPEENKMFSIYLKQDGDKSDSSILFGGLDEGGFLDHTNTTKIQADENYSFPINSFAIGDTYSYLTEGTRAVFDPSYPFIYMPKADFRTLAIKINAIFPTRLFYENTCETKWGTCYIEMSCEDVAEKELNETLDYHLEMNI